MKICTSIGIDEISIRKGHEYRIVISDPDRKRPIWFGGEGRREEDLEMFFRELGARKTAKIRLAVMDMWKPFTNAASLRPHIRIVSCCEVENKVSLGFVEGVNNKIRLIQRRA